MINLGTKFSFNISHFKLWKLFEQGNWQAHRCFISKGNIDFKGNIWFYLNPVRTLYQGLFWILRTLWIWIKCFCSKIWNLHSYLINPYFTLTFNNTNISPSYNSEYSVHFIRIFFSFDLVNPNFVTLHNLQIKIKVSRGETNIGPISLHFKSYKLEYWMAL